MIQSGIEVLAYDNRAEALEGLPAASSNLELVGVCPVILLSLPNSKISRYVISELSSSLKQDQTIIDTTTGDPSEAEVLAKQLSDIGVHYLDATVGGNSKQVLKGDVIVLAGGPKEIFEPLKPLFDSFAKRTFHLGDWGAGSRMKLVLNLVLGLNRAVLAEALTLAEAYGFDLSQTLEVLKEGPAYSKVMDLKGDKMIRKEFSPDARLSQHLKDVRLILQESEKLGTIAPLSEIHRQLLEKAESQGHGEKDNSAVILSYQTPCE